MFLLSFISIFNSCKENLVPPEETPVKVYIESLIPDRPLKIGEKFMMIVKVENLDSAKVTTNYWINDLFHYNNDVSGDTLFSYVPYIFSSTNKWIIKPLVYGYNGISSTEYSTQDTVVVITENCLSNICIKWSDLDSIKEVDSYIKSIFNGNNYKWVADKNYDTLTISISIPTGEGYNTLKLKLLDKGANTLPEFLEFNRFLFDGYSQWSNTLSSGIIKIQDWNTSGVISGIILSELEESVGNDPDLPTRAVFWFDFSN
jgi:hypothetical protein